MILPMAKVEIIGRKSDYYAAISVLHMVGCVQLEDIKKELIPGDLTLRPLEPEEKTFQEKQKLEEMLVRLNSILSFLEKEGKKAAKPRDEVVESYWTLPAEKLIQKIEKLIQKIDTETRGLTEKLSKYETELSLLRNFETIVSKVEPLVKHFSAVKGYETTALIVEKKNRFVLDLIYDEIKKITGDKFEVASAEIDEKTVAALIFYPADYSRPVHNLLWEENVSEIRLPESFANRPFADAIREMKERLKILPGEIKKLRSDLEEKSKSWREELEAARYTVINRLQEYQIIDQVGQTEFAFVIVGWVPRKYLPLLRSTFQKHFGTRVLINEVELTEEEREEAPVCMENPVWAKAYELVLKMWSLPKYGTFDPTPLVGFFYALFFGMIIGDIGYGFVLLLASMLIVNRFRERPLIRSLGYMFLSAAIMVILFGFIYNEFFGFHFWEKIGLHEIEIGSVMLPIERGKPEYIENLLIMCLAIGVFQLLLGQVIGIVNGILERSKKHILEKFGMLILILSAIILLLIKTNIAQSVAALAMLAAIFLIAYGGGVIGVVHIFSIIGKAASYLRIMALGLAGVILAIAANQIGQSVGAVWVGFLVASIFHLINLVVHSFSSTIHSLRLNLIEFFDQFYESGGKEFTPFKREGF